MTDRTSRAGALAVSLADMLPFTLFDADQRTGLAAKFVPVVRDALDQAEHEGFRMAQAELERFRKRTW